jgi:Domain of unknown function (DUF6438)
MMRALASVGVVALTMFVLAPRAPFAYAHALAGLRSSPESLQARDTTAIVTLTRTSCRGFCPAYTVSIGADRRIRFNGDRHVRVTGLSTSQLSRRAMTRLTAFAATRPLSRFDADYGHGHKLCTTFATDLPGVSLSVRSGGVTQRVRYDMGCMDRPPALDSIANMIDSVAGTKRWLPSAGDTPRGANSQRPS